MPGRWWGVPSEQHFRPCSKLDMHSLQGHCHIARHVPQCQQCFGSSVRFTRYATQKFGTYRPSYALLCPTVKWKPVYLSTMLERPVHAIQAFSQKHRPTGAAPYSAGHAQLGTAGGTYCARRTVRKQDGCSRASPCPLILRRPNASSRRPRRRGRQVYGRRGWQGYGRRGRQGYGRGSGRPCGRLHGH
jgi:hypothetical protein